MSVRLQEWIHKLEVGSGNTVIQAVAGVAAVLFVGAFYNMAALTNLNTAEGMDQAQVARNLVRGKGFTTSFIRPLSLHVVYERATNQIGAVRNEVADDTANAQPTPIEEKWLQRLQDRHPDLANPPLYPLVLAGALKLCPFPLGPVADTGSEAAGAAQPSAFAKSDLWVIGLNQVLLLLVVLWTFRLAASLFDKSVAWLSCVAMVGSDYFWQLTQSGQSHVLQSLLFLALVHVILAMERIGRDEASSPGSLVRLSVMAGLLLGLLTLTRYTALLLLVPAVGLVGTLPRARKMFMVLTLVAVFLATIGPWFSRNYQLSGNPFGISGYSLFLDTPSFPADTLERSVHPDFREFSIGEWKGKFFGNLQWIFQKELPQLGGSWLSALFLVGLLVPFRNPVLGRVRGFVLATLALFVISRCLDGRLMTGNDMEMRQDPSLSLAVPLVFMYGVSLFLSLLDQLSARILGVRWPAIGVFCLFLVAPLLLAIANPVRARAVFPPYYPPWIEQKAALLQPNDWIMSDIPWAIAWYGDRSSVWLTPYYEYPIEGIYRNDFFEVHERFHSIKGLYLSSKTTEKIRTEPLQQWIGRTEEGRSWEDFVWDWETFVLVGIYLRNEVPSGFPLQNAPVGIYPEIFLLDSERLGGK